jgi:hypothetical protein
MAKRILLSRGQFWRLGATGFVVGFFLCRLLERYTSPHVEGIVSLIVAFGAGGIALSAAMTRYPRFMDYDKD